MNAETAGQILLSNYKCENDSFMFFLHERNFFCEKAFWAFYDSIAALASYIEERTFEKAEQITQCYQRLLKYIIFHFDPDDDYILSDFPVNYIDYMERIEYAVMAFFGGNASLTDDDIFELKRPQ